MRIGYVRYYADAGERELLRRINEERAAAIWGRITAAAAALGRLAEGVAGRWRRWRRARETRTILLGLDDRMLADIGLTRAEAAWMAEEAAGRAPGQGATVGALRRAAAAGSAEGDRAEVLALPARRRAPAAPAKDAAARRPAA
jgi:uncharacterized protein YjiS (DUF1127 family)